MPANIWGGSFRMKTSSFLPYSFLMIAVILLILSMIVTKVIVDPYHQTLYQY
jgi:hypothetical protein